MKILIEVEGGIVQAVRSDKPGVTVRVVDWDNIRDETDDERELQGLEYVGLRRDCQHDIY